MHLLRNLKFINERLRNRSAMTDYLNIHTLSWYIVSEGQERVNRNSSLLPTFTPCLIREGKPAFTLAEGATHVALLNKQHKIAFTLAEVLITLGIIGIVAAMTMPALVANYQKKQTVTQLKRTYSILSQALVAAQQEYGDMSGWEYSGMNLEADETNDALNNFVQKYLEPHIKIIEYCYGDFSNKSCFYKSYSRGGVGLGSASPTSNVASFIMNDGVVVRLEFDNNGGQHDTKFGGKSGFKREKTTEYVRER